ncbi:MAG TPA: hypothetical protein VLS45_06620 [Methylomicrobium sp.]|nr:hypothetical protein [Methylomicrobium sp.]
MNKPSVYAVIVILWIITLVAYLILNRYHTHYDRGQGVTSVFDKWSGTVQTIPGDNKRASLKKSSEVYPQKPDVDNSVMEKKPKLIPDVKDSIQNKEP